MMKMNFSKIFNNYYVNIVKKTSRKPVENSFENCNDKIGKIIKLLI